MRKPYNAFLLIVIALAMMNGAAVPADGTKQAAAARPPAVSLARPASATKSPDADGFLQRWLILEPIRVPGQLTDSAVQTAVKKEYFSNQLTVMAKDGDIVAVGDERLTWHAVDTINYNVNLYHFAYALNRPTSNVLFWIVTVVNAPRDIPNVRLAIGSNAASVWWVDGQEVIHLYNDRQTVIDDGVSKRLTLKQGPHVVRAAIINAGGATDFCARFLDEGNRPVNDIAIGLDTKARQDVALKDLMPNGMTIGVAINQRQSDASDTAAVEIITKQFNQISPENLLKFQSLHPAQDRYVFEAQDRYVQFGLDRKMQVVGHNLVWHRQTPAWVFQGSDGQPADRETLLARMREHIHTVVGRYKGKIHGWDVVNEAIEEDGSLRKAPWHDGIGDDYVAKAFEFAHEADPDAELYYNDYNLEKPAKRAGVIRLVKDLQARGLRIDGIGNQGHWQLETPTIADIEQALTELHETGLKVMYSELDINMLPPAGPGADPAVANPYANGLPAEKQQQLANRYADVFGVFIKHHDWISRVTFWGLSDADSWLNRGRANYPLLWDRQRQPKPAFEAVVDALKRAR